MKFFNGLASFLCCFMLCSVQAQDTLKLSLQEAIDYAIENSNSTKNARLEQQINKKMALEIITEGLPRANVGVVYQNNLRLPTTVIPPEFLVPGSPDEIRFGTPHNFDAELMATQLIVDGRYFIGLKANKTLMAIGDEQVDISESDVRNNVTKAYAAVLVSQQSMAFIDKNLATLDDLLLETTELYKSGFSEELDVDRLDLQQTNMESTKQQALLQLMFNKHVLKLQMGLHYTTGIILTDDLEELLAEYSVDADQPFDPTQRREYRLLNYQWNMRHYDAKQTVFHYFPSITAFASVGYNAQRSEFNLFQSGQRWFRNSYWGIELRVPIFDGFKSGAVYQQKKLEREIIKNDINNFEQQANLEVIRNRNAYKVALDQYNNQKKNLALAEKIYNKVQIMYREGVGSSLELANAESSLTETQSNYINAIYDLLVAKTDLDKALGNY